ncbi:hypothetical protein OROHE_027565 [Orobanche hederae]
MRTVRQVGPHRLVVRTSLFQGDKGDSNSPGGRVLLKLKEVNHGLSISLLFLLAGSMPERLMGTDCKFVGNMSTLVQIQLGPIIRQSTMRWYKPPLSFRNIPYEDKKRIKRSARYLNFPGIVVQIG